MTTTSKTAADEVREDNARRNDQFCEMLGMRRDPRTGVWSFPQDARGDAQHHGRRKRPGEEHWQEPPTWCDVAGPILCAIAADVLARAEEDDLRPALHDPVPTEIRLRRNRARRVEDFARMERERQAASDALRSLMTPTELEAASAAIETWAPAERRGPEHHDWRLDLALCFAGGALRELADKRAGDGSAGDAEEWS